jgi:hypothetical protein
VYSQGQSHEVTCDIYCDCDSRKSKVRCIKSKVLYVTNHNSSAKTIEGKRPKNLENQCLRSRGRYVGSLATAVSFMSLTTSLRLQCTQPVLSFPCAKPSKTNDCGHGKGILYQTLVSRNRRGGAHPNVPQQTPLCRPRLYISYLLTIPNSSPDSLHLYQSH